MCPRSEIGITERLNTNAKKWMLSRLASMHSLNNHCTSMFLPTNKEKSHLIFKPWVDCLCELNLTTYFHQSSLQSHYDCKYEIIAAPTIYFLWNQSTAAGGYVEYIFICSLTHFDLNTTMSSTVIIYIYVGLALLAAGLLRKFYKKPLQDIRGPQASSWLLGEHHVERRA